jgi:hypothetical protein
MQGPTDVIAAAIHTHPDGRELRVFFEREDGPDVLTIDIAHDDAGSLEEQAEALRGLLREQGWWPVPRESHEKSDDRSDITEHRRVRLRPSRETQKNP